MKITENTPEILIFTCKCGKRMHLSEVKTYEIDKGKCTECINKEIINRFNEIKKTNKHFKLKLIK